jgi:hypothetical protein
LDYLEDAIKQLRICAWVIVISALAIIAAAGWGVWLDRQGRLNPLLASIHLTPNWAEMLFVAGVVALFFLILGLLMLWAIGDLRKDTKHFYPDEPVDQFAVEGVAGGGGDS